MENMTAPSLYRPDGLLLRKTCGVGDFSLFSKPVTNTLPLMDISIGEVYELITSQKYAAVTHVLRELKDKETARNYKARNFDYACFSGIFNKRCEAGLIRHSNLLTLDFDHVQKVLKLMHMLIDNTQFETVLAFVSPSGDGLKWIVKIDLDKHSHLQWFRSISNYVWINYHLQVDQSGKDVSRCCFLPYDPQAYINEKWTTD